MPPVETGPAAACHAPPPAAPHPDRPVPASVEATTGLGTRGRLIGDLLALTPQDGVRVLAVYELAGFDAYARMNGVAAGERLVQRLAGRVAAAVEPAGAGYRIDLARFAVLIRPGRVHAEAIVGAAAAALSDDDVAATLATAELSAAGDPVATLERLERGEERRPAVAPPAVALSDVAAPTVAAPTVAAPTVGIPIADARRTAHERRPPRTERGPYLRVVTRFRLSVLAGLLWVAFSTWLAWTWIGDLADLISLPGAIAVIGGIALIPGYLNVQLIASLVLDRPRPLSLDLDYPALTLLVAAYEEEATLAQTLAYALDQDYPGPLHLTVIDDGSRDATAAIVAGYARLDPRIRLLTVPHGGKAKALNAGLAAADTPLVATIDADTLLMPGALRRVVARLLSEPEDTVAVAGSVLVRNSRSGPVGAAQSWDYFLGIGSIKRQQALLQATLVAQGAFSVYVAAALREAGAWPDTIGEDIVMTWALLDQGGRTSFEGSAVAFTEVPTTLRQLARQRRRWARGMIEGLERYGVALVRRHRTYAHGILANAIFPYLDLVFTFAFIPGIVLACFGIFVIVGPMTLAVLPLNLLLASIMYRRQRGSLTEAGLHVRRHGLGLVVYVFLYQLLLSPVSVAGYAQELMHRDRSW